MKLNETKIISIGILKEKKDAKKKEDIKYKLWLPGDNMMNSQANETNILTKITKQKIFYN